MADGGVVAKGPVADPQRKTGLKSRLSRIRALLLTAAGRPQGFFTQYQWVQHLQPVEEPYPEVEAACASAPFHEFLEAMTEHLDVFRSFGSDTRDPVIGRGMFPPLDGMVAYTAIRRFKPRRVIEIGSGDSTYFLAK